MKNHKIICNSEALKEFIEFLPDLENSERYFLCLQARKKYMPSLKANDKTQLKRFVSSKKHLYEKICQLECPIGTYKTKEGDVITDKAMVLYITANPRDMRKATLDSIGALANLINKQDHNPDLDMNPHSEVLSVIHKSKSRSIFVDFEIDRPNYDDTDNNAKKSSLTFVEALIGTRDIVGEDAVSIIETRGGAHVLIKLEKVNSIEKNWYPMVKKFLNCDQSGDLMVPVVGCNQGGFMPRIIAFGK